MSQIADLQKRIAEINREKGWYDRPVSFGDLIALIHSEASEALEAFRVIPDDARDNAEAIKLWCAVGDELADIVIRTLDTAERMDLNLESFILEKIEKNAGRPYRHGNKRL